MGNKWSATPSFTSEILNDNDDGEPPDIAHLSCGESTLTLTFLESKHLKLDAVLGSGKHNALIRVVNSFNTQCYTKPLKFDNQTWFMPKRRFVFVSSDPEGEIRISLCHNNLPPLPAVPSTSHDHSSENCGRQTPKERPVLAKMTVPLSFVELKQMKRIDRWFEVVVPGIPNQPGEIPQVRVSLDFNYMPTRTIPSVDSLLQKYDIEDTLGTGVSVVKRAVHRYTKKIYAIKYLQKTVKGQNIPRNSLDSEIELLRSISHPNIVQLYETMEDPTTIYLILEYVKGMDLFDISDILGTLRPASVVALLTPLLSAISYLHSRGIVHHDIKPENIIIDYSQNTLKLTDFGSARPVTSSNAVCGTLNYMAPEVLLNMRGARNVCDKAVDVWSIGVLTYLLISGVHPFDSGKSHENILNRIIAGKFDFKSGTVWNNVPKECKDFIKRCLVIDPKKRATVTELQKHLWIVGKSPSTSKSTQCKSLSFFSEEECERIAKEKTFQSSSRTSTMGSLLELFSNEGVSRS